MYWTPATVAPPLQSLLSSTGGQNKAAREETSRERPKGEGTTWLTRRTD